MDRSFKFGLTVLIWTFEKWLQRHLACKDLDYYVVKSYLHLIFNVAICTANLDFELNHTML